MADLRDRETAVDVARNESQMGDSGRRARSQDSCYLLSGGSRDVYSVTVNYDGGHFCKTNGTGVTCRGNLHGKGQKFGAIHERDTSNPNHWCKHVQAVLRNPEQIAEAQEITARAFGGAAQRLKEIEKEAKALQAGIAAQSKSNKALGRAIAALIKVHGSDNVQRAVKAA